MLVVLHVFIISSSYRYYSYYDVIVVMSMMIHSVSIKQRSSWFPFLLYESSYYDSFSNLYTTREKAYRALKPGFILSDVHVLHPRVLRFSIYYWAYLHLYSHKFPDITIMMNMYNWYTRCRISSSSSVRALGEVFEIIIRSSKHYT